MDIIHHTEAYQLKPPPDCKDGIINIEVHDVDEREADL